MRNIIAAAATLALTFPLALGLGGCDDEPATSSCIYTSDCPENQICAEGRCIAECRTERDCPGGAPCVEGMCGGEGEDAGRDGSDAADAGDLADVPDFGPRPGGYGSIEGIVHFRLYDDTLLPVAQPIVYWTYPESPPESLPVGASCDCGYPAVAVTGGVDGTFTLTDVPAGWVHLVVQKGNFRRRRLVEVLPGETLHVPLATTELPVRHDPENGDEIPRIVIGTGRFDAIEDIFAKLRMGPITPTFGFDHEAYMADPSAWGVELMLYQQPRDMDDTGRELVAPSFPDLLGDGLRMRDYHVVFAPCGEYETYGTLMTSESVRHNVRDFVNEGGKLYVTDYSYDVLEQVWPEYIDFSAPETGDGNADGHVGDPAYMGIAAQGTLMYESDNKARDPYLGSWLITLDASDDGTLLTTGNWVNLNSVGTVSQCCLDGDWVDVTPDVVMNGPNGVDPLIGNFGPSHDSWEAADAEHANHPHTVRFAYGCGEVMYSTYHTVDHQLRRASLAPQELVLLWLILEIGECNLNPVKAPD